MSLKPALEALPQIYRRYVTNVDPVSRAALLAAALTPASTPS